MISRVRSKVAGLKVTTMASNPLILSGKHPCLFHSAALLRPNLTQFKATATGLRSFSPCVFQCNHPKILSRQLGFRVLSRNGFRVESIDNGGGGYGGSNGGGGGGGDGGSSGNKWSILSWYLKLLEAHPVWTKAITSALLTFIGDLICQILIDKVPSLDLKRVSLFTFLGMALVGPTLHFWYLYLSKLVTMTGASGAFLRLIIDQFMFAPAFIGVFLSTLVTLEGRPSQVLPKLQQEWVSSVIANWQLWIPFQFLNFLFVPQQFQVLAANFIALVWNVILSYKAHKVVAT